MKFLTKPWKIGMLVALVGGGTLLAGPAGDTTPTVSATIQVDTHISLAEMLVRSKDMSAQVSEDLRHVHNLQEVARKQKDLIKLTCVNDKLITLKAQANIFDEQRGNLEALSPDNNERFATYQTLSDAAVSAHRLRSEADTCVGEPELTGESANSYTHPPFPDNPTLGDPFAPGVEPPGYASPFN